MPFMLIVQMEEIAVDRRTTTNTARSASAWTAHTRSKAMHAPKRLQVPVAQRTSSAMASATIKTTMPDVPGMTGIAVVSVARSVAGPRSWCHFLRQNFDFVTLCCYFRRANSTSTATNVHVWIASTKLRATNVLLR